MVENRIPRIVITPGEPAGVGPDVTIKALQLAWPAELIVIGDTNLLLERAQQIGLSLTLKPFDFNNPPEIHTPHTLKILPVELAAPATAGKLDIQNAAYVIRCLEVATDLCLDKTIQALVTGPVHKGIINDAAIPFTGHTEFLANRCNGSKSIMLFVVDNLKVALATTHIPLADVARTITKNHLTEILRLLHSELKIKFNIAHPTILVCGLNPHAGEMGHLGHEETDVIDPVLKALQREGIDVRGPFPADTIFTPKHLEAADTILAMYHDQALPVVKYIGFDRAVNVTLGLPIIRTSVDHGTALDIAGTVKSDAGSMIAAIRLALSLI